MISTLIVVPTVAPRIPRRRWLNWVATRLIWEIRSLLRSAKSAGKPWLMAQDCPWLIQASAAASNAGEALIS